MGRITWWVDAAFAVHHDLNSHTGGVMMIGKGTLFATSTKQKLNIRSLTKAELVGVNDVMPQILWTIYFLEAQGMTVRDNVVYQDNQISMRLEKYGKGSDRKRTRHINIRYFFVTDLIAAGELTVDYCPTNMMVADFYTKPLQGKLFRIFRNRVLNLVDDPCVEAARGNLLRYQSQNTYSSKQDSGAQECVGHYGIEKDMTK
eukprot:14679161-Ditylum_brightwellii.AAC.1